MNEKGLKFETVEKQKKTKRSLTLNLLLNEGTRLKLDREYQLDSKQRDIRSSSTVT